MQHGGDIYHQTVELDFSVNINPLGMPPTVQKALQEAAEACIHYPDLKAEALTNALAEALSVSNEQIICGNGASELFLAIVHALQPKRILIPVPSFLGYERVAEAVGAEIIFYAMKKEESFRLTERFLEHLTEEMDLLFLANPNNPTGAVLSENLLLHILARAKERQITVVLDECFLGFTGEDRQRSMRSRLSEYPNLIVVRAFTKLYAIPGVRLGYLLCADLVLCEKIRLQLPEWNVSVFAQCAGVAALKEQEFVTKSVSYMQKQRKILAEELCDTGLQVYESDADYLFFFSEQRLYEPLLEKKILIRDCSNYRGLKKGYYRVAVKKEEENRRLIEEIRRCLEGGEK
ncbi:MAG: pyridoxal phosphate-dependent aminotransferase [Lachnospiraceae bacterium]